MKKPTKLEAEADRASSLGVGPAILVADSDAGNRRRVETALRAAGYQPIPAADGRLAQEWTVQPLAGVVLSLGLRGVDPLSLLPQIQEHSPGVPIIVLAAEGQINEAVAAVRRGATEILTKPFTPAEILAALTRERTPLPDPAQPITRPAPGHELIGTSAAANQLRRQIQILAERDMPVLILGEPGTGRRLLARLIHEGGGSGRPFVPLSCPLLGDELPAWDQAEGGTLLLEDLGELSRPLQVQLLETLPGLREMVGLRRPSRAPQLRLLATGSDDLTARVARREFPAELYYRMGVVVVVVPPLRDRREDVPALAEHFLELEAAAQGVTAPRLSVPAQDLLVAYPWPGNLRELRNALAHALAFGTGRALQPEDFPAAITEHTVAPGGNSAGKPEPMLAGRTLAEVERICLRQTLALCDGSKTAAAKMLGVSEKTVYNHLTRMAQE